jgi:starch phosphorylase
MNQTPGVPNHFSLPRRIKRLSELSYNLWWVWNPDAQALFTMIDKAHWERTNHNPVVFLRTVERARLNAVTFERYYLDYYDRVMRNFDQYMQNRDNAWYQHTYPEYKNQLIGYFSFEFGLHESLPVYAGGLGVLSGDYLKEASDLGLPLAAVGFLYTQGYFSQRITEDGWQEANNLFLDFQDLPILPLFDKDGSPLTVSVDLPGRQVHARLWEIRVGRVPLYLLDTNIDENNPADRQLTARLYSSDMDLRISQEMILGIGGVRALRALGCEPNVWHMNEGHSAFMILERIRELVSKAVPFEQAAELVKASNVFTTHTPVPAGNDEFPLWLIDKYFTQLWDDLGLNRDQFIDLARHVQTWGGEAFSMPVLALRYSDQRNAVSELHGHVSRQMWHFLWPQQPVEDVPITHITNGVHTGTWLARRMRVLYDRYLGPDWIDQLDVPELWQRIETIPDAELWAVRRHLKRKLMAYVRERARRQWLTNSVHPVQVIASGVLLDPYMLTIGFARRFATYKRASLVLRDFDRLLNILNQPNRPVQIIFAGKSHPADEPGKMLIQEVYRSVKNARNGGRLVFLEDYDMNIARYLVQGVDVWLNTPRRPNEASGTSGEKAAINGVLNFSILDGWWREGYNGSNGWAIGDDTEYSDPNQQDEADADSLYCALENEIIPTFYNNRSADNVPVDWIARMKESIRTLTPQFSMRRMVKEYVQQLYLPALLSEKAALPQTAVPAEPTSETHRTGDGSSQASKET